MNKTYLSIEDMVSVPSISQVTLTDDGRYAAFVKKSADLENNVYTNTIWRYDSFTKDLKRITDRSRYSYSPLFSPDKEFIAYLAPDQRGKMQIFIRELDGGYFGQMTNEVTGISKFKWHSMGDGFYYLINPEEDINIKRRTKKYGAFKYASENTPNNCLCYMNLEECFNKISKHLSDHNVLSSNDFYVHEFAISPDGTELALITSPTSSFDDYYNTALYFVDTKTNTCKEICTDKVLDHNICFSPFGDKICFKGSIENKAYYKSHILESTLWVYDIETGYTSKLLNDTDSSISILSWSLRGMLLKWQNKTHQTLAILDDYKTFRVLNTEKASCGTEGALSFDGQHVAYISALENETFEVYLDHEKITDENNIFANKLKSTREVISWKSTNGLTIEGILTKPTDFDKNKKYPLLVIPHGGPTLTSMAIYSGAFNETYPIEKFIEKGFLVLEPNYRGSCGYGNNFLKANFQNLGLGDYGDIISGVKFLIKSGFIDKSNIGIMGWSQGGFISAFCSIYDDIFKAASVGCGISNWTSYYVNTVLHQFTTSYLGATPWKNPALYNRCSPINYINSASTPTLIQHGELDIVVPLPNAYELYHGLKDNGAFAELVIFKGMGHSPTTPSMAIAIMEQNLRWFSHYLLGESLDGFKSL